MKRVISNHKAQAAMEFMMTYGWAIMIVLIAIAALSYMGVTQANKNGLATCVLPSGFSCKDFIIWNNGISLDVTNGLGTGLRDMYVNVINTESVTCTESGPYNFNDGETRRIDIACNGLNSGSKFKGDIVIRYIKSEGILQSSNTGTIAGQTGTNPITITPTSDTEPPVISMINAYPINSESVIVQWTTHESASSLVKYGTSPGIYTFTAIGTNWLTIHNVNLNGLTPSTTYYYVVNSSDASGNTAQSSQQQFTTSGPGSPSFTISNVQSPQFACVYENPPITFRVTNTGTASGIPTITYVLQDVDSSYISPTPTNIAPGSYVDFQLNIMYNFYFGYWSGSITVNPGSSTMPFDATCQ